MTIWVLVKSDVSTNIVSTQPEEIAEMFEKVKAGHRVYDVFGRDVTYEVVDTVVSWYEYDAMKIVVENRVCEFFKEARSAEDIVILATIARYYEIKVDNNTIVKAIWSRNPNLIPIPPKCLT